MMETLLLEGYLPEDIEFPSKDRKRAWRRKKDYSKAKRKEHISMETMEGFHVELGRYKKGKIHCSCPLCSAKTNSTVFGTYGRHGNNYKPSDLRRAMKGEYHDVLF